MAARPERVEPPAPPVGFFTDVCPAYRSGESGLPYLDGTCSIARLFQDIVVPLPARPASTATPKAKREHSAAEAQKKSAVSLWRHIQGYYKRAEAFPPKLEYLMPHAIFVVRAMEPGESMPAARVMHLSGECCPE